MDADRIADLSLKGAMGVLSLGLLLVIVFSTLIATIAAPEVNDASSFASVYEWQQRVQVYTTFRELGQAFILGAIPLGILAVGLRDRAPPSPAPAMTYDPPAMSVPTATVRRKAE